MPLVAAIVSAEADPSKRATYGARPALHLNVLPATHTSWSSRPPTARASRIVAVNPARRPWTPASRRLSGKTLGSNRRNSRPAATAPTRMLGEADEETRREPWKCVRPVFTRKQGVGKRDTDRGSGDGAKQRDEHADKHPHL